MATKDALKTVLMPMAGGVDERTQAELVDPSRNFLRLENLRSDRRGSYTKRPGFSPMVLTRITGSARSSLRRVFANDGNLCTIDSAGTLDAYVEQATAWRNVGMVPECTVSRRALATGSTQATKESYHSVDLAEVNGYRVVAFHAFGGIGATVYDAETGAVAYPPTMLESAGNYYIHDILVVAAADGTRAHVIYANGAGTTVYRRTFNTASLSSGWAAKVSLSTALVTPYSFDAASFSSSWGVALITGANQTTLMTFDDDGTAIGSANHVTNAVLQVAIGGSDTDTVWLANTITAGGKVRGCSPTTCAETIAFATIITPSAAPLHITVTSTGTQTGILGLTDSSGKSYFRTFNNTTGTVTGVSFNGSPFLVATGIASRAWLTPTSRIHVCLTQYGDSTFESPNAQKTMVVVDLTDALTTAYTLPRVVATIAPRLEIHNIEDQVYVTIKRQPFHVITSGSKVYLPATIQRSPIAAAIEEVTLDYASTEIHETVEYQGATYIGGGLTSVYDGARVVESNFVMRPHITAVTPSGAGTITLTGTGWTYVVIFEAIDARGQVHRSAPSDPVASSSCINKAKVTLEFYPLCLTNWQTSLDDFLTPVNAIIYRTTDSGSTYYRLEQAQNRISSGSVIAYDDTTTDAVLIDREQLYTQPGLLGTSQPHAHPPGLRHIVYHQDRIIGVGDDGYTLWPSAPFVYGEGMWWADVFQVPIPDGGPVTALASSDGRLYAFKRDRIFVIDGDGPSDNGTGGQFSAPQRLPTELGCLSHRSVVVTPVGIFFQSPRGIEVLTGQQVQWVGELVQQTLETYPTITSAVCRQTESRVYFTCTDSGGTSGVTLVFDYAANAWTVDTVYDSDGAVYTAAATHAVAVDGAYYRGVASTGRVWEEQATCLDNTTWITATIETGWIKPGGMHGAAEIPTAIFAGVKESPCSITVEWAYDYRDEYQAAQEWDEPRLAILQRDMGRIHLEAMADENARGMSAKLRLSDAPPTNTSYYPVATAQGITWFGYSVEAAVSPGRTLLPVSARAG
jgi:hypothetical protein